MKIIAIIILLVSFNFSIDFKSISFEEAKERSRTSGKLIFVDVYADWCGPCRAMKKTTFKDVEVAGFFNDKFINLAVNGESKEGQKFIKTYKISAYPTVLFIDSEGNEVSRKVGYQSSSRLLAFGQKIIEKN